jgi:hypothetical protein
MSFNKININNKEDKATFWMPLSLEKAKNNEGVEEMRIKGVASTMDEDSDGEFLDPKGFDLNYFKKSATLNWHHKSGNDPSAIVGEPTDAKITKKGLEIEGILYEDSPMAKAIYKLAQTLEKNSKTRRLGFSIEGKVIERDSLNPKIIKKAKITGCAITHMPKNSNTFMEIVKGEYEDACPEYVFDNTEESESLSKSEVFEKIYSDFSGISTDEAKELYNKIIKSMKKNSKKPAEISSKDVEKAYDSLGLFEHQEDLQKGEDEEDEDIEDEEDIDEESSEEEQEESSEDEEEDEDEEEEEETTMKKSKTIKKSHSIDSEDILKAIEFQSVETTTMFKALGKILKRQDQELSYLRDLVEQTPVQRKTITKSFSEKEGFKKAKSEDDDSKSISCSSNRKAVLELLDRAAFEKGYDPEFGKAMTAFEAGAGISDSVISKIETKFGVKIID